MEIKEILNYFLNSETNIIEVSFRTIDDSEEVFRTDNIDYNIVEDYGFNLEIEPSFDLFGEDLDDEFDDDLDTEIDEDELLVFLNEYYTINPHKLPKSELY